MHLLDHRADVVGGAGEFAIHRVQDITEEFLAGVRDARNASANAPCGDTIRIASVPVAVVETWLREGFDIFKEPARAIVARLKAQGLDAFLTSDKAI